MQHTLSPTCNNLQTLWKKPARPGQEYSTWPTFNNNAASPVRAIDTSQSAICTSSGETLLSAEEKLIGQWAEIAIRHAITRAIADPGGFVSSIVGIRGAWGHGGTRKEALEDLQSVLVDWVRLKLEDGDDDIPSMEGLHLTR